MHSAASEKFLQQVLSRIVWKDERAAVREELSDHLEDHTEALIALGRTPEEAEQEAIAAMGDPEEIGRELNRQHRPYLGWAVWLTNAAVILIGCMLLFSLLSDGIYKIRTVWETCTAGSELRTNEELLWERDVDLSQTMDGRTIRIRKIGYTGSQELLLAGAVSGETKGWSFSLNFTSITDEKGREYHVGSGYGSNSDFQVSIRDVPEDISQLTLIYDRFGRHMEFHLDLTQTGGADNEKQTH